MRWASSNQSEDRGARLLQSRFAMSGMEVILPASDCSLLPMPAAMPQSLCTCRDPAVNQASIQQIHLRDGVTEYQRGHRAGPRTTILHMHAGNITPD
jgi:hypothetical protein